MTHPSAAAVLLRRGVGAGAAVEYGAHARAERGVAQQGVLGAPHSTGVATAAPPVATAETAPLRAHVDHPDKQLRI